MDDKYSSVKSEQLSEATDLAQQIKMAYAQEDPDYHQIADWAADLADLVLDLDPEQIRS